MLSMRVMLLPLLASSAVLAQDVPAATSAADLLEQLRAAGVEIPDGFVANDDGSVSLPASPVADDAAGDIVPGSAPLPELKKAEWDTKLNIGLNISSGNTDQVGFASTIVSTRTTETSALTLDAGYFYSSENNSKTASQFTAGVLHDWLLKDSKWLYFADARYDFDEFKSYDQRVSAHGGVGYRLIEKDKVSLTLRAGAGFTKEFGSSRNEIIPEAMLGFDFTWDYADNQGLEVTHRFFPDLSNGGEFRMLTTAGWRLDIDKDDGLAFTVNLLHEYVSDVDPGIESSDLKLFAGVAYDF